MDKGALAHLGNLAYASLRAAEDAALVRLTLYPELAAAAAAMGLNPLPGFGDAC